MAVYYNENDRYAAAWLEESIKLKLIAPGVVDTRSIKDVQADDLRPFAQIHLFAGIGGWSYALRQAGWPDERQVLTGSAPCQPFSVSGNQRGFSDDRHLWPEMFRLITELQPLTIFGEQVASEGALHWWDDVASSLEREDYATAAIDMPAASVGAFHQRSRLFWVAEKLGDTDSKRQQEQRQSVADGKEQLSPELPGNFNGMANAQETERERGWNSWEWRDGFADNGITSAVADTNSQQSVRGFDRSSSQGERQVSWDYATESSGSPSTFGNDTIWLLCRDGKLRPTHREINPLVGVAGTTKPSSGQVADGVASGMGHCSNQGIPTVAEVQNTPEARIMRLKGYGNAINTRVAIEFIRSYMEI